MSTTLKTLCMQHTSTFPIPSKLSITKTPCMYHKPHSSKKIISIISNSKTPCMYHTPHFSPNGEEKPTFASIRTLSKKKKPKHNKTKHYKAAPSKIQMLIPNGSVHCHTTHTNLNHYTYTSTFHTWFIIRL